MTLPHRVRELRELQQCEELLQTSFRKKVVFFKHSTRCPISANAYEEWVAYLEDHGRPETEYAVVYVVENRPVSDFLAQALNVKHESPQILLAENGKAVWHASHWDITYSKLCEALGEKS